MFINKECSISMTVHIYRSLESVDIKSTVVIDCQFPAKGWIGERLIVTKRCKLYFYAILTWIYMLYHR